MPGQAIYSHFEAMRGILHSCGGPDEKVREETSNAELLKEPISLSFGAQQLVNEESRGDEVVHPVTACRMETCLLKVLADLIPCLETGMQE